MVDAIDNKVHLKIRRRRYWAKVNGMRGEEWERDSEREGGGRVSVKHEINLHKMRNYSVEKGLS